MFNISCFAVALLPFVVALFSENCLFCVSQTDVAMNRIAALIVLVAAMVFAQEAMPRTVSSISKGEAARFKGISELSNSQLYEQGENFRKNGETDSALIFYSILSNRYSDVAGVIDKRLCALSLLNTGQLYYDSFNYANAMDSYLNCQRICEDNRFDDILADVYRSIGNIYSINRDYERSVIFYEKSLDIAGRLDDNLLRLKALNNLVGANFFLGKSDEAGKYYNLMLKYPCDDKIYRYDVLMDGGLLAAQKGDMKKAVAGYKAAADYAEANGFGTKESGAAYSCLAMLYEQCGQTDSALYYHHRNEAAARATRQNDLLTETLRHLSAIYRGQGDFDKSLRYQSEYMELADSIFNQSEFNSLKNAEFLYELNKTNKIIDTLNVEKRQKDFQIAAQRYLLWGISVAVIISAAFTIVVYRQKRRLQGAYAALFSRNKEILENEKTYRKRLSELEAAAMQPPEHPETGAEERLPTAQSTLSPELYDKLKTSIVKALEQNDVICDPEFSVNRLAEIVGSNTTYVSCVINDVYGKNFRAVLTEYRIKESMQRLNDERYSNFTIKAIAESVGYRSQSSFIAAFTKQTGIKPSIYQKMAEKYK